MSITVTNAKGHEIEFKDQRGPTCGLYALSFVLEYLYDIKIPAIAADGDKTTESLRSRFKKGRKTVIGELYDATPVMADYIKALDSSKIKCESVACAVPDILGTLNAGGLCMVPFCVEANPESEKYGHPCSSGINAHWCVLQKKEGHSVDAYHWGRKYVFDLDDLLASNNAIKDVAASWWGKEKDSTGLCYYRCEKEDSTTVVDSLGETHRIKEGSIKPIPATALSQTLAGKMLIFAK